MGPERNEAGANLATTTIAYDGDDTRVKKSDPSGTTLYLGLTEVALAYTPPTVKGNTGVSADGFDVRKRGATVGWDAGVFDGQHAITQTGFAQVRVDTKYSGYRLFGLTTSDIGGGFCPTWYGLELVHGGTLEIYENCVRVAYPPALVYGAGDQLRIEADAGVVRYKRQVAGAGTWQVLYTSTLPVTAALYFNASLYTPGSTLKEIRFVSGSTGAPSVNRTYYTFGGARVAMRDGAGAALVYLHGDQLGSASLATSMTGTVLSQQRYKPYGEVRWSSGAGMPTDFTFTSQRASSYGTIFMSAREYLPSLGRFLSADSIVPGAGNPQALNRYAYVLNRPLRFVDPSGHDPLDQAWLEAFRVAHGRDPNDEDRQTRLFSLIRRGPVSGGHDWTEADWAEFGLRGRNYWFGGQEADSTRTSLGDFVGEIRDLATHYSSNEAEVFVSAIALLYAGIPYNDRGGSVVAQGFGGGQRIAVSTCPSPANVCGWLGHRSIGFGRHVTNNDREENTHHYAGHLLAGYWLGTVVNTLGAIAREVGEGSFVNTDGADIRMSEVAGTHGAMLRAGVVASGGQTLTLTPGNLAEAISVDLAPTGR